MQSSLVVVNNITFPLLSVRCNEGRIGRQCECSTNEVTSEDLDKSCRKDNGTDICSNNGDCVCGTCECKKRENPEERYSGKFCECDNFNCDRSNNKLCGGTWVQFIGWSIKIVFAVKWWSRPVLHLKTSVTSSSEHKLPLCLWCNGSFPNEIRDQLIKSDIAFYEVRFTVFNLASFHL